MSNTLLNKNQLKELLITSIQEDENFKRSFVKNPEEAIANKFGKETLDALILDIDRDTSGILHIKICDRSAEALDCEDNENKKSFIHLLMLDN